VILAPQTNDPVPSHRRVFGSIIPKPLKPWFPILNLRHLHLQLRFSTFVCTPTLWLVLPRPHGCDDHGPIQKTAFPEKVDVILEIWRTHIVDSMHVDDDVGLLGALVPKEINFTCDNDA